MKKVSNFLLILQNYEDHFTEYYFPCTGFYCPYQ